MEGHGTLVRLEKLKRIHGPKFKAAAAKRRRRIDKRCLQIGCAAAWARARSVGGELKISRVTCSRKKCPKEELK